MFEITERLDLKVINEGINSPTHKIQAHKTKDNISAKADACLQEYLGANLKLLLDVTYLMVTQKVYIYIYIYIG